MKSVVLVLLIVQAFGLQLPANWKRCRVAPELDNKPNECLRAAIEDVIEELCDNGNKEFGIPDLDPLYLDTIAVSHGDGPLAINLKVTDSSIEGNSAMKISSVSGKLSSPKDFKLTLKFLADKTYLKGIYDISGRIIILPIAGNGKGNMTLEKYTGKLTIGGQPKIKNGTEYLKITDFDLDYDVGRLKFRVDNLFNGNQQLGEIMNNFLNENWLEFHRYARPTTRKIFSAVFSSYAKKIFERVPFKDIFLTN